MTPKRFVLIGNGYAGSFNKKAIDYVGGELVACCDILPERASAYPGVKPYTDWRKAIQEKADLYVICTPSGLHYEMTVELLKRDKNVIVEKPVIMTPQEMDILETAKKSKGFCFPILQNRYNPYIKYIKEQVLPLLGEVFQLHFAGYWRRDDAYFTGWHAEERMAGSILHQQFLHHLDLICYLFGEVDSTHTLSATRRRRVSFADSIVATFTIGKTFGTINCSVLPTIKEETSLTILAERGFIEIGGKTLDVIRQWDAPLPAPDPKIRPDINRYPGYTGSLALHPNIYENILGVLEGKAPPFIPLESALSSMKFIFKLLGIE
jgi:UDP-N-acetyl-2-amino-2-deoxyglucuronate dehydrogenase